jgi:hypothetical protein
MTLNGLALTVSLRSPGTWRERVAAGNRARIHAQRTFQLPEDPAEMARLIQAWIDQRGVTACPPRFAATAEWRRQAEWE